MSMDYYIYLKQLDGFDPNALEQYAKSLNLCINLPPTFDVFNTSDFTPIRFARGKAEVMTGFEFDNCAYCPEKGFFRKLRKKTPFERAIKDSKWVISITCRSYDPLEVLMAHLFGAYLVKDYEGVFDDPQVGTFYDRSSLLELEIDAIVQELRAEGKL